MEVVGQGAVFGNRQRPGESWLIDSHDARIVIDVGHDYTLLGERAANFRPDIVILSHADNDHIGGFREFATALRKQAYQRPTQYWLPADWHHVIASLRAIDRMGSRSSAPSSDSVEMPDPHEVFGQPASVLVDLPEWGYGEEELGDGPEMWPYLPDVELDLEVLAGTVSKHRNWLAETDEQTVDKTSTAIASHVETKSKEIIEIVRLIRKMHGHIIWFDVDACRVIEPEIVWRVAGIRGVVTIVNAVPVRPANRVPSIHPYDALLMAVQSSIQNFRSLVTHMWAEHVSSGRGFTVWSDSTGQFASNAPVPWEGTALMTSPHHGSHVKNHDRIWAERPLSVRVMQASNDLEDTYRLTDVPQDARSCTACAQLVGNGDIFASSTRWGWELLTRCKDHPIPARPPKKPIRRAQPASKKPAVRKAPAAARKSGGRNAPLASEKSTTSQKRDAN